MATFTKILKDLTLPEQECAIFEVRFEPKNLKVAWFREETEVLDGPEFRILTKNGMSTLVIGQVFVEDTGNFTAQLYNPDDTPTNLISTASLTVTGGRISHVTGQKAPASLYNKGMNPDVRGTGNNPQLRVGNLSGSEKLVAVISFLPSMSV